MSAHGGGGDDDLGDVAPESPVALPLEDTLDLHSFPPAEVADVVREWLDAVHAAGFHDVRVVHGRGIGVQRELVRAELRRHPAVEAFADASGNWGSTVIRLRPR